MTRSTRHHGILTQWIATFVAISALASSTTARADLQYDGFVDGTGQFGSFFIGGPSIAHEGGSTMGYSSLNTTLFKNLYFQVERAELRVTNGPWIRMDFRQMSGSTAMYGSSSPLTIQAANGSSDRIVMPYTRVSIHNDMQFAGTAWGLPAYRVTGSAPRLNVFAYEPATGRGVASIFDQTPTYPSHRLYSGFYPQLFYENLDPLASFAERETVTQLDIDFGTVEKGGAASQAVSIWNRQVQASEVRDPLSLERVETAGQTGALRSNVRTFTNLAPSASHEYLFWLDTSTAGEYSATYQLVMRDDDASSAGVLTVNLSGEVIDPVAAIPEPASLLAWLLLAGLPLGALRRRRR